MNNLRPFALAVLGLMLIAATAHLVILAIYALQTGDWLVFNLFAIIDAQLLMPQLTDQPRDFVVGIVIGGLLYLALLLFAFRWGEKKR